ncbi:wax ester/triacylglycerol synthase family O-acyltransferase [Mycobacterium sp. Aquia_213]|uniref:wax ester/triacylglycerol synthase family O-acyltransferase n=1 Tax=Mycobacterium sp. Aquia_213 TaxID=2991728 RepID=UPI00226F801F|nr:wax ester/triacylglycerol synthase family O-acyltransferase [Mycobacterium sp. Aquia_213]WAC92458.1 wax ester/triacylglycerol synthase family O-acyltransferase [Mycobacterium sp. Aquia_213]
MLRLETSKQPMTACGMFMLDTSTMPGGYSFEAFREKLLKQIDALPEFRMKLADSVLNIGAPVWVDDPDFDLDNHLHRIELPAPGGPHELSKVGGRLVAERMDRGRPVWDMFVIEGLVDADPGLTANVAVMLRMQHVLADGQKALDMFARLCSTEADPPSPEAIGGIGTVSNRQIVLDGWVQFACRPWHLTKTLLSALVGLLFDARKALRSARGIAAAGWFGKMPAAPRTPFNGKLTSRRTAAYVQLDLADAQAVKDRFGVTVNDVMLAVISGALRRFLLDRAALPNVGLLAWMPIAVSDPANAGRNQVAVRLINLHSDVVDPADRLRAIAGMTSATKRDDSAIGSRLPQYFLEHFPGLLAFGPRIYRWAQLSERRPVNNVSVSNVRGPATQSYLLGAAITGRYAFGPIIEGGGLDVVVMSLYGKLDIGLVCCPDLVPDLWDLADGIPAALLELQTAAG